MNLGSTGESRVRGYLYILERSLRSFLPRDVAGDAVREVESHIRERVAEADGMPNERDALERILTELGSPLQVARGYSDEMAVEDAVATGRVGAVVRAVVRVAATGISAFAIAIALFVAYVAGISFIAVAVLKPIFPSNVGVMLWQGIPIGFGVHFGELAPGTTIVGGYWVVPISLAIGLAVLILTHRSARAWLRRWRGRFGLPNRE